MSELREIIQKFADCGWDVINGPAKAWLEHGDEHKESLKAAVEQANRECGSCGCEFDPLYAQALTMLSTEAEA